MAGQEGQPDAKRKTKADRGKAKRKQNQTPVDRRRTLEEITKALETEMAAWRKRDNRAVTPADSADESHHEAAQNKADASFLKGQRPAKLRGMKRGEKAREMATLQAHKEGLRQEELTTVSEMMLAASNIANARQEEGQTPETLQKRMNKWIKKIQRTYQIKIDNIDQITLKQWRETAREGTIGDRTHKRSFEKPKQALREIMVDGKLTKVYTDKKGQTWIACKKGCERKECCGCQTDTLRLMDDSTTWEANQRSQEAAQRQFEEEWMTEEEEQDPAWNDCSLTKLSQEKQKA